jgi:putative MATE family efflux protein
MTKTRRNERVRPLLTSGAIGPQLVRLALPMVAGILAMLAFNMVDTFFVGRLGTDPLAAMALTFPVVLIVTSLSLGLGVSTSIAISQLLGAGNEAAARRLTTDALVLTGVVGVVLVVAGHLLVDRLLAVLGAGPVTHELAARYLKIWFWGVPFLMLQMAGNMAIRATGNTLVTGLVLTGGMLLNCVLDPLFIFGLWGLPTLGISGAAIATVIARGVTLVAVFCLLRYYGSCERHLGSWQSLLASWGKVLRNGVPIALNNLLSPLTIGALTWMVTRISEPAVAGYGVAGRVESLLLVAVFSLQSVIGIFIAQNSGAGRWDRVRACVRIGAWFAVIWGVGVFALLAVFGQRIAAWFNPSHEVVDTAYWYFVIVGGSLSLRGVYFVLSAVLNSLDYAAWATALTIVKGLLFSIPLAWFLGRLFGVPGIFAGLAVGHVAAGILTWGALRVVLVRASTRPQQDEHAPSA